MKENKYDDESFFKAYSEFPRSVQGLSAAGEWHELQKLLPDFKGKHVLDIGCGFGWHCVYAAQKGATSVLGIDISQKMLDVAREKTSFTNVEYRQIAMEDMDFAPNTFDVVLSSLAFHYTPDFKGICKRAASFLTDGGEFIFSVEHPTFTALGTQDWIYNANREPLHWPVDNYFMEGERNTLFLGEVVTKYHRTLTSYLNALLEANFIVSGIVEPTPSKQMLNTIPQMQNELRRPMMLLISAKKKDFIL